MYKEAISRPTSINCHLNVLSRQHEILIEFRFSLLMPLSQQTAHSPPSQRTLLHACVFVYQERREEIQRVWRERKKLKSPIEFTSVQRRLLTVLFVFFVNAEPNKSVYKWWTITHTHTHTGPRAQLHSETRGAFMWSSRPDIYIRLETRSFTLCFKLKCPLISFD